MLQTECLELHNYIEKECTIGKCLSSDVQTFQNVQKEMSINFFKMNKNSNFSLSQCCHYH